MNNIVQDQNGFFLGCDLTNNTYKTLNLISCCKIYDLKVTALSIYIQKAYDSIEILYMQTLLKRLGYGDKFPNGILALYNKPISK